MTKASVSTKIQDDMNAIQQAALTGDTDNVQGYVSDFLHRYTETFQTLDFAGRISFQIGAYKNASRYFSHALNIRPNDLNTRANCLFSFYQSKEIDITPDIEQALLHILMRPEGQNIDLLTRVWVKVIKLHPLFSSIVEQAGTRDYDVFCNWFENLSDDNLRQPAFDILLRGMTLHIVPDIDVEWLLTCLRRWFLLNIDAVITGGKKPLYENIILALGECGFNNQYLFDVTEQETANLHNLLRAIEKKERKYPLNACTIGIVSAYMPLLDVPPISEQAGKLFSAVQDKKKLAPLIAQHITNPRIERELEKDIKRLSVDKSGVSSAVRAQYEENPYPCWRVRSSTYADDLAERITPLHNDKPKILVAGCATGWYPINIALTYPNSEITGIDLSLKSLAYARRKAAEMKIRNLTFIQGDLLDIADIGKKFDVIESVGVLHHMENPDAGLKALVNVLEPEGFIKIGLYSRYARQHITECQNAFKDMQLKATPEDIRRGRHYILSLPPGHPFRKMESYNDFYTILMLRDMLFHVQERCYTIPDLKNLISACDLEFFGFTKLSTGNAPSLYQQRFPDDPDMRNLDNWDALERENPDTFIGMYNFWCVKKELTK